MTYKKKNKINLETVHKTSQKTLLEKNDIVELHLTMFHLKKIDITIKKGKLGIGIIVIY